MLMVFISEQLGHNTDILNMRVVLTFGCVCVMSTPVDVVDIALCRALAVASWFGAMSE